MDLKKMGKIILLTSFIIVVALNFIPINFQIRLFLGSFGFGSGLVLIAIGNSKKYDF